MVRQLSAAIFECRLLSAEYWVPTFWWIRKLMDPYVPHFSVSYLWMIFVYIQRCISWLVYRSLTLEWRRSQFDCFFNFFHSQIPYISSDFFRAFWLLFFAWNEAKCRSSNQYFNYFDSYSSVYLEWRRSHFDFFLQKTHFSKKTLAHCSIECARNYKDDG